jgi:hypothetical protein
MTSRVKDQIQEHHVVAQRCLFYRSSLFLRSHRLHCLSPSATPKAVEVPVRAQLLQLAVPVVALKAVQLALLHADDTGSCDSVAQRIVHEPVCLGREG